MPEEKRAPDTERSGRTSARSCDSDPKYWPSAVTVGLPDPVPRLKIDVSRLVVDGARLCQAASAAPALAHGQLTKNHDALPTACVRIWKLVTMPKLPPPPPRQAQYRSGFVSASAVTSRPSAVTIRRDATLSHVSPKRRPARPMPPPSACPPIPTEGHDPAGIVAPAPASLR